VAGGDCGHRNLGSASGAWPADPQSGTVVLGIVGIAVLLTIVAAGLVFIQPEERGVVISAFAEKGYREQALQPGLNWVIPFAETVVIYPISRQTYTMSNRFRSRVNRRR